MNGWRGECVLVRTASEIREHIQGRTNRPDNPNEHNAPRPDNTGGRLEGEHAMAYGGSGTKRQTFSIARIAALAGEVIGLLNKGSASTPAAPGSEAGGPAVSTNSLNVTRVGGVGALISGAGGAALLLFKVNKSKDPHAIVVAAYISVGVIVAAALVTAAMIIVADVRARTRLAASASPAPVQQVKYIQTA